MSIIIANWKMKLGVNDAVSLANDLKKVSSNQNELVVCPSFVSLVEVARILKRSKIKLGAQDCFWETKGAYTGEVSPVELREVGCEYVIIGHSERREHFKESDKMVHQKIKAVLAAGLTPIICVGETFDQRSQGATDYVLIRQTINALEGAEVKFGKRIIIAYEPVWVIGTGQAISPEQASLAHQVIRQTLFDLFPAEQVKRDFLIIYGGSVDSSNVSSFTRLDNIDGVLVGAASVRTQDFLALIKSV